MKPEYKFCNSNFELRLRNGVRRPRCTSLVNDGRDVHNGSPKIPTLSRINPIPRTDAIFKVKTCLGALRKTFVGIELD